VFDPEKMSLMLSQSMEHQNSFYCKSDLMVKMSLENVKWGEREKMRGGLCLLHLLDLIRGDAAGGPTASGL